MTCRTTLFLLLMMMTGVSAAQQNETATGGSSTVLDVDISADTPRCEALSEVFIVRHGTDEIQPIRTETMTVTPPAKPNDCHRRAKLDTYHTNVDRFSLRIPGMGRSDCIYPEWHESKEVGVLQYSCCDWTSRQFVITMQDATPLQYARTFRASRCTDEGTLRAGNDEAGHTIHAVQLPLETLSLKVFENKTPACGIALNNIDTVLEAEQGAIITIDRETAEKTIPEDELKHVDCHAPMLSGSNIDMATRELRFRSLTIKVQ